ncbi:pseudouridine-5'-phosphate glycosidase [Photobacterium galatheae]|uniref:Pseudouridine-5'-phosphate glycosidase n=1 Tax=Photobacterium galatheae TaxID=1654360 RepID=A0A066RSJ1_9GAMM|nr:pseudouridine-5'-phosphate glycosidase [Photobacterium galatheae]KDM93304.1 pseudouridine-5'-phosphate glycosidase [Photobacterium galatheae]MCM0150428.1 pseudouridine-5'-phosphate glycosidase [Photobacterium galatheae]
MFQQNIPLEFHPEVKQALEEGKAVVALESNVITHGLDYPDNVNTALAVEEAVRKSGAVPATIGIDHGTVLVGMNREQIERFASASDVPKVSSRDLPMILASGKMGATTVASSLVIAELAGISFFSSAGIGGVHRGAQETMDVSSDLIQFTRSKVAVVCAGAKNILDIGLTLEFLETQCVPLISYQSDDFPAFYCRSSGHKSPMRMDDASTIAKAIEMNWALPGGKGFVITTPTKEEDAIDSKEIELVVQAAVRHAEEEKVTGNAITKHIMKAIEQATQGRSATANMAVLIHTAEVAGQLAVAHHRYKSSL